MNRIRNLIIAVVILLLLLATMVTYRVAYNEAVIITTFGSAGNGDEAGVKRGDTDAGLGFKWPWPIQNVARRYDTRIQQLETRLDQLNTSDRQSVAVSANVFWRVSEPLDFYNTLSSMPNADRLIRTRLREALATVGEYRFNQLVNDNPDLLRRDQIESEMLKKMQAALAGQGVELVSVGMTRVVLGTSVTEAVFERMREEREADAVKARSEGASIASNIRTEAEQQSDTIHAFAEGRASEIRAQGDAAAGALYPAFAENEEFAKFLQYVDMLPQLISENGTIIVGPDNLSLLKMLSGNYDYTKPLEDQPTTQPAEPTSESTGTTAAIR